jgi:hypothetical protein
MIALSKIILLGALNSAGLQPADPQVDFKTSFTNEESVEIIRSLSTAEEIQYLTNLESSINQLSEHDRDSQLKLTIEHYGKKLKLANAPWAQ